MDKSDLQKFFNGLNIFIVIVEYLFRIGVRLVHYSLRLL